MKKLSPGEEAFALHCRAECLNPEREFYFAKPRQWRFDFAFPAIKLAIEIEGGTWSGGRHSRGSGYDKDCEKYSEAAILGWRVIRVTTGMVNSGQAINYTIRAIEDL